MSAEHGNPPLPYPLPTEAPDGPGAFLALVQRILQDGSLVPVVDSESERDTLFASAIPGNRVWRSDKDWAEVYGGTPEGWYPFAGAKPSFQVIRAAMQSIPTGNQVATTYWGVPTLDADFFEWTAGVLKVKKAGMYSALVLPQVKAEASGGYTISLTKNSVDAVDYTKTLAVDARQHNTSVNSFARLEFEREPLAVNDELRLVINSSTATQIGNIAAGRVAGFWQMTFEGPA